LAKMSSIIKAARRLELSIITNTGLKELSITKGTNKT
jgi:hypothetical protein